MSDVEDDMMFFSPQKHRGANAPLSEALWASDFAGALSLIEAGGDVGASDADWAEQVITLVVVDRPFTADARACLGAVLARVDPDRLGISIPAVALNNRNPEAAMMFADACQDKQRLADQLRVCEAVGAPVRARPGPALDAFKSHVERNIHALMESAALRAASGEARRSAACRRSGL